MNDELKILISADMNIAKSTTEINTSIRKIASKVDALRLKINVDNSGLNSMITQVNQLNTKLRNISNIQVNSKQVKNQQELNRELEKSIRLQQKYAQSQRDSAKQGRNPLPAPSPQPSPVPNSGANNNGVRDLDRLRAGYDRIADGARNADRASSGFANNLSTAMQKFPVNLPGGSKTSLIAGTPLELIKLQRKDEICLSVNA